MKLMRGDMGMSHVCEWRMQPLGDTYHLPQAVLQPSFPRLGLSLSSNSRMIHPSLVCNSLINAVHHNSVNLVVVTPLTENMPGPSATKPGDMLVIQSSVAPPF